MDQRIITVLQGIREGSWQYGQPSSKGGHFLMNMATDLGLDATLGNPATLPATGGAHANKIWDTLGYPKRRGVGGLPCEIVHCGTAGNSCTGNALVRGVRAFGQALLIYAPVSYLALILPFWPNLSPP